MISWRHKGPDTVGSSAVPQFRPLLCNIETPTVQKQIVPGIGRNAIFPSFRVHGPPYILVRKSHFRTLTECTIYVSAGAIYPPWLLQFEDCTLALLGGDINYCNVS